MRSHYLITRPAWLLLLVTLSSWAVDHSVTVGGMTSGGYYGGGTAVLSFSPSHLTINAGDTVTFTNSGGMHNVHSDAGSITSFQCSNDCTSDNLPSVNAWSATVAFPTAGTINFHCDEHQSMGMTGSITVNAVQNTINLGGYLSGNWDDPTPGQSGHGFQLEFTNQANTFLAIWFVYPPGGGGQNWIYAQGTFDAATNTATIPAILLSGPQFPPLYNNADLQQTSWGTLTFTFTDCDHGTASLNSTVAGYGSGTIPIQRITSIQGTTCPQ